jgi:hypothetical protein
VFGEKAGRTQIALGFPAGGLRSREGGHNLARQVPGLPKGSHRRTFEETPQRVLGLRLGRRSRRLEVDHRARFIRHATVEPVDVDFDIL